MMGQVSKTDKLDTRGLAILARNGILPEVWIPPGALRDQRELPRMRTAMGQVRTKSKNRIHFAFAKYEISLDQVSDLFGKKRRKLLEESLDELPPETRLSVQEQLWLLDRAEQCVTKAERRISAVIKMNPAMQWLETIPGVGPVLP